MRWKLRGVARYFFSMLGRLSQRPAFSLGNIPENFRIRKFALGVAEDQSTTAGAVGTVFRLSYEWRCEISAGDLGGQPRANRRELCSGSLRCRDAKPPNFASKPFSQTTLPSASRPAVCSLSHLFSMPPHPLSVSISASPPLPLIFIYIYIYIHIHSCFAVPQAPS